ncbi:hypothetical protein SAMN05661096_02992 [Marivirga sericea]|uniref:Uncharacterized protein n=1 Tax=Marivirga sericea TaxID=1028 RepID=A0A1X7KQ17_9BACT|nr:hypothetical protein [Marivirga sericea]SMG43214.1 hypothetical protein SAMN05661096_02992 [Marivirga sericea]
MEQIQRINLGPTDLSTGGTSAKRLTYVASALFMLGAVFNLIDYYIEGTELARHLLISATHLLAAILFFFKNRFELSSTSKYAPHLMVYGEGLGIKTTVFSKAEFFTWDEIVQIELGSTKIGVKMKESQRLIYYKHQMQKKSALEQTKRTIEAVTASKGIEVKKIS